MCCGNGYVVGKWQYCDVWCVNRGCRGSDRENCVAVMVMWLASGSTVMLGTYCELLVFHAYSETNYPFRGCFQSFPTNTGFESS